MPEVFNSNVHAILMIGPTGVGKSPLGNIIAEKGLLGRTCHHLDFGSELRHSVSGGAQSAAYTSDELTFIHGVLERGLLLENEHFLLAKKIITLFFNRVNFSDRHILILNGIPRHEGQARDLGKIVRVHALLVLECTAEDIFIRIHNNIGGDRTGRVDDSVQLIEKKVKIFVERTAPLIRYYEKMGSKVYHLGVSASMTPFEVYRKVSTLAALNPPVALITEPPEG